MLLSQAPITCAATVEFISFVISRKTPLLLGRGSILERAMAEPAARCGHVAAAVDDKVYLWGGRRGLVVSHDGRDKAEIRCGVNILDVNVSM